MEQVISLLIQVDYRGAITYSDLKNDIRKLFYTKEGSLELHKLPQSLGMYSDSVIATCDFDKGSSILFYNTESRVDDYSSDNFKVDTLIIVNTKKTTSEVVNNFNKLIKKKNKLNEDENNEFKMSLGYEIALYPLNKQQTDIFSKDININYPVKDNSINEFFKQNNMKIIIVIAVFFLALFFIKTGFGKILIGWPVGEFIVLLIGMINSMNNVELKYDEMKIKEYFELTINSDSRTNKLVDMYSKSPEILTRSEDTVDTNVPGNKDV